LPLPPKSTTLEDPESIRVEEARQRHIQCARRSLQTNLTLFLSLIVAFSILVVIPERELYSVLAGSSFKGVWPILTAVANFGPVRVVVRQYWSIILKTVKKRTNHEPPSPLGE